ncbi:hypothetical protein RMSM_00967 [Rhodopirellula maiorica SM1]|uniref:Uncharacterized protein n=1 Tax=Rhodopirellula maiorica SM1 TaxID=1265738 RepID=M5RRY7_9BACT|nr:hypothetical protein RMSM_00967 [Rhodopirellula maiorica SM1]
MDALSVTPYPQGNQKDGDGVGPRPNRSCELNPTPPLILGQFRNSRANQRDLRRCDFLLPLLSQRFDGSRQREPKNDEQYSSNLVLRFQLRRTENPAAGLLYPVFGVLFSPVFAAAAMSLSSVLVVFNAVRLRVAKLT